METVAALFVEKNGPYSKIAGVEVWGADRDALLYRGNYPVVAHPPCGRWGRYYNVGGAKLGDDQGCGQAAIEAVRRCGGVLEHPAGSWLFASGYLPDPGKQDLWGGRTLYIEQWQWGHRAIKPTWLYVCGEGDLASPPITQRPDRFIPVEQQGKLERRLTPMPLAIALIDLARGCRRL